MSNHPFDLTGRVVVITGGNGGLGLGMANTLAELGASVCIWGRNPAKNAAALEAIQKHGGDHSALAVDICDWDQIDAAMAQTLEKYGRVDGMIANAGVGGGPKPFVQRTAQEWRDMLSANVEGVVRCFQVAAMHMMERAAQGDAFGRLICTSSVASIDGAAFNEHYGASKGALNSLVRATAVEVARHGITVNAILPGYAESEMTAGLMSNDKFVQNVIPRIPMRRFGRPDDYGGIASYLMSGLSSYHTGQCFVIDGGYTIY
ncbi:SDR family oxidoreductase [Thalassobius vesicularis]|uniref:SDR family oxidoreductase n=1 Tax=Thalassobius vesicularis TaxID=1294297 RepID=A0A4S3ME46_9RHOB|nr:SDR family oxidoreductase [Thalassobius vesicularis]THD76546.1 SDR family oxidoreductase [Thalassobius vesicularis]